MDRSRALRSMDRSWKILECVLKMRNLNFLRLAFCFFTCFIIPYLSLPNIGRTPIADFLDLVIADHRYQVIVINSDPIEHNLPNHIPNYYAGVLFKDTWYQVPDMGPDKGWIGSG